MNKRSNLRAALDVFHFARVHYSYYDCRYSSSDNSPPSSSKIQMGNQQIANFAES
jgi:hypothetical protein